MKPSDRILELIAERRTTSEGEPLIWFQTSLIAYLDEQHAAGQVPVAAAGPKSGAFVPVRDPLTNERIYERAPVAAPPAQPGHIYCSGGCGKPSPRNPTSATGYTCAACLETKRLDEHAFSVPETESPAQSAAVEPEFKQYRRKRIAEMRPVQLHETQDGTRLVGLSVSDEDRRNGSPRMGDMVARNPANHADTWLVSAQHFSDNFELPGAEPAEPAVPVAGELRTHRVTRHTRPEIEIEDDSPTGEWTLKTDIQWLSATTLNTYRNEMLGRVEAAIDERDAALAQVEALREEKRVLRSILDDTATAAGQLTYQLEQLPSLVEGLRLRLEVFETMSEQAERDECLQSVARYFEGECSGAEHEGVLLALGRAYDRGRGAALTEKERTERLEAANKELTLSDADRRWREAALCRSLFASIRSGLALGSTLDEAIHTAELAFGVDGAPPPVATLEPKQPQERLTTREAVGRFLGSRTGRAVAAPPAQSTPPFGGLCTCQHASDHSLPHEPHCAGYKQPAQPTAVDASACYCSDRMSAGLPCLPGRCPNVPAGPVAGELTSNERVDMLYKRFGSVGLGSVDFRRAVQREMESHLDLTLVQLGALRAGKLEAERLAAALSVEAKKLEAQLQAHRDAEEIWQSEQQKLLTARSEQVEALTKERDDFKRDAEYNVEFAELREAKRLHEAADEECQKLDDVVRELGGNHEAGAERFIRETHAALTAAKEQVEALVPVAGEPNESWESAWGREFPTLVEKHKRDQLSNERAFERAGFKYGFLAAAKQRDAVLSQVEALQAGAERFIRETHAALTAAKEQIERDELKTINATLQESAQRGAKEMSALTTDLERTRLDYFHRDRELSDCRGEWRKQERRLVDGAQELRNSLTAEKERAERLGKELNLAKAVVVAAAKYLMVCAPDRQIRERRELFDAVKAYGEDTVSVAEFLREQKRSPPADQMWLYAPTRDADNWNGPHDTLEEALAAARSDYTGCIQSFWVDEAYSVDWEKVLRGFADADDLLERFGEYVGDNEGIEDPEPEFKVSKDAAQGALEQWAVAHLRMRDYWQCIGSAKEYPTESLPATDLSERNAT